VTRGIVVMEHPIVRNSWSHANNSFSYSFKHLTLIKLINSLSLRHKFGMDDPLTVKRSRLAWILFLTCSFYLFFSTFHTVVLMITIN